MNSLFIVCRDPEKSRAFYETLGFQFKQPKSRSFVMQAGNGVELHLHEQLTEDEESLYGVERGQGSRALVQSFEVGCIDSLLARIPPDNLLRGPLSSPWGTRLVMVSDPDGHLLEFSERTQRA
ncbi:MAG: VOC family protein [Vulcanimicrobiota bacterium]